MDKDNGKSVKNVSIPSLTRRGFLEVNAKLAALAGAGSMVASNAPKVFAMGTVGRPSVEAGPAGRFDEEQVFYNTDALNCNGMKCVHKVFVRNGRITRIGTDEEGDPEDPWVQPQLRACLQGRARKYETYSPFRVKYPLERTGPRGSGQFRRVSWDYALNRVAGELKRVVDTYGPKSLFAHCFASFIGGTKMDITYAPFVLSNVFGGFVTAANDTSFGGGSDAWMGTEGGTAFWVTRGMGGDLRDVAEKSNYALFMGFDPAIVTGMCNTMFKLVKMKERLAERGVKVVGIDPKLSQTLSALADEWLPVRPQTDAALMSGMAYTIITEGLLDRKILDRFTVGFEKFQAYILGQTRSDDPEVKRWADGIAKTPEWAERICGVPAAKIREVAINFATRKPAPFFYGYGPGHGALGVEYARFAGTLAFMTGNVGEPGTFVGYPITFPAIPLKYLGAGAVNGMYMAGGAGAVLGALGLLRMPQVDVFPGYLLGKVLNNPGKVVYLDMKAPDVRAILDLGNTICKWTDANDVRKGFLNPRVEFIVSIDIKMTPSAKHSDIVLPACTTYEKEDFMTLLNDGAPGSMYMQKAIEPLWESREDVWIWQQLADRWGIGHVLRSNPSFQESVRNGIAIAKAIDPEHPSFEEMRSGEKALYKGKASPTVSLHGAWHQQIHNGVPFQTASGKFEIYSEWLERTTNAPQYRNLSWLDNDFPGWRDMKVRVPAIPTYRPHWEGWEDPLRAKYPIVVSFGVSPIRKHTCHGNNPVLEDTWGPEYAWVNRQDAEARGIKTGDMIDIFNDRGRTRMRAFVTDRVGPNTMFLHHGKYAQWNQQGIETEGAADVLSRQEFVGPPVKLGLLTMWMPATAWGHFLVDFVKTPVSYELGEESFRSRHYTFEIDGEQQTIEGVMGPYLESITWEAEKAQGKTAERNVASGTKVPKNGQ